MSAATIEHIGIIDSKSDEKVLVRFTTISACASCHAKGYCSASEMEDKLVEVNSPADTLKVGESVNLKLALSQGFNALLIGYVYPFILVFSALMLFTLSGVKELYSGLSALFLLLPYYLLAGYFNKRINKKFQFTIHKIDQQ